MLTPFNPLDLPNPINPDDREHREMLIQRIQTRAIFTPEVVKHAQRNLPKGA